MKTLHFKILIALILNLFLLHSTLAYSLDKSILTQEQRTFLSAYDAIKASDRPLISQYKNELKDYVLLPYLNYLDIRYHMDSTPESQFDWFLNTHQNHALSPFLEKHYLRFLAKKNRHQSFLKYYDPSKHKGTNFTCSAYTAILSTNPDPIKKKKTIKKAQQLWSKQLNISKPCQPLDKILQEKKLITGSMIWARVIKNMQKGKLKQAKKIAQQLSLKDKKMLNYWLKFYNNPHLITTQKIPSSISPIIRKEIFMQAIKRLSYSKPKLALKTLTKHAKQYGISTEQQANLTRNISLRFAYKYHPKAQYYLANIDTAAQNEKVMNWRLQIAIRKSDWLQYLDLYQLLPETEQQTHRWTYWKARSLEALGRDKTAHTLYSNLAKNRNFYGFLSADKLNLPYQFNPKSSRQYSPKALQEKYPQLLSMKELIAIDWKINLKIEWYHLLNTADKEDIEPIAHFISTWQQHNLAIQTIAKAKMWDDLAIRFPTPFKDSIKLAAKNNAIDPAWVYGVIRRESAFSSNIKSSAGAVGLMQLMPATAKYIGRKNGFKKHEYTHLTQAESNIKLGSAYLSYLAKKYSGNRVLATAAYNAGPRKVNSWIPKQYTLEADQWIDTIPYTETRNYVKAVMEYTTIFKSVLHNRYDRLENFMGVIGKST